MDLKVSPTLLEAMRKSRPRAGRQRLRVGRNGGVFSPRGSGRGRRFKDESAVEALPAFAGYGNPTLRPRRYDVERPPDDLGKTMTTYGAIDALRGAVAGSDAGCRKEAAAAAWHAEPIVRFFCSTFGDGIVGVRVSEENFIVLTAELSRDDLIETSIAVGPEGTCACKMSVGERHLGSMARRTSGRSSAS